MPHQVQRRGCSPRTTGIPAAVRMKEHLGNPGPPLEHRATNRSACTSTLRAKSVGCGRVSGRSQFRLDPASEPAHCPSHRYNALICTAHTLGLARWPQSQRVTKILDQLPASSRKLQAIHAFPAAQFGHCFHTTAQTDTASCPLRSESQGKTIVCRGVALVGWGTAGELAHPCDSPASRARTG